MGIFDGYLLVSDIDGTFEHEKTNPEPKVNTEAIKYFTQNGGRFAFATGRMSDYLVSRGIVCLTNAPSCFCNGGFIYDPEKDKVLYRKDLRHTVKEIAERIRRCDVELERFNAPLGTVISDYLSLDISNIPTKTANEHPIKAVAVLKSEEEADALEAALKRDPFFDDCYICKSWKMGVEILRDNATKGDAIEFIKEYTGAKISVGIGDCGNDLPLIQHADIGVAVMNAENRLKAAADIVVCDCDSGAIADLIYKLEEKIKSEE